jgi:multidrug efflux pump subunit AcrB
VNIAELSIRRSVVTMVLTVVVLVAGVIAYNNMSRLEDPEYTIKQAVVITEYPGATPREVEEEVTDRIEQAIQQMGQLKMVYSQSERGRSTVTAEMKDRYDKSSLPQVWDELRRKINDVQGQLPPGVKPSIVNDDYGDVYGVYLAITGDGFSYEAIRTHTEYLQKELLRCSDVAKVVLYGVQPAVVYVEPNAERLKQVGLAPQVIFQLLSQKNLVVSAGQVKNGREYMYIQPTGEFTSVEQIGEMLVSQGAGNPIYLRDIAEIRRGYVDPPQTSMYFNGEPAIGLGISTVSGGNVVRMGQAVDARLGEIEADTPIGLELHRISFQADSVTQAVSGFVVNLLQAVAIVIIVLLVAMGLRSGLIIGFVLVLTIMGTMIVMHSWGIAFERISLGALIIALGMLVDNAIVVTDGMLVRIGKGEDRIEAAKAIVGQTKWPLLGATAIAVLAFAAIGASQDSTGEYCRSLFQVMLVSLSFSWVTAVTVTPLLCYWFLKGPKSIVDDADAPVKRPKDEYSSSFYRGYKRFLKLCLRFRPVTLMALLAMMALAAVGFRFVDKSFFPPSTRPQLMVNIYLPQGVNPQATAKRLDEVAAYVGSLEGTGNITTTVQQGSLRFLLTYTPEKLHPGYGQLLVDVDDASRIPDLMEGIQAHLDEAYADMLAYPEMFVLGSGAPPKIQLRFRGPDATVLRDLSAEAQKIMAVDGNLRGIRDDWMERTKVVQPIINDDRAQRAGLTRAMIATTLEANSSGLSVGVYREDNRLLPILARLPDPQDLGIERLADVQIWSPRAGAMIPLRQVVDGFETVWEDPVRHRRHRMPQITVKADPIEGEASDTIARIQPAIEAMDLPPGYVMEWGGEYEDSANAQAAVASNLPVPVISMVLITVILFNSLRKPLIIWLTVPMAIIGVTAGLLLFDQPFGFMALLGTLSLSGMLIKNAIVLIDEIGAQNSEGKEPFQAIVDAAISRARPVIMAAGTTVLGMLPLLKDNFFVSMAVAIMVGLTFATVLTLIVVPTLYMLLYRVRYRQEV